jgi:predicted ABC-class ATPase
VLDSRQLEDVFLRALVPAMTEALQRANTALVKAHVDSVEDQEWLRRQLPSRSLVAFVANGSVLPRSAGHLDTPLQGVGVEPFVSPAELEVSFTLPRQGRIITGMGVPTGLTMLVGGGFQGKSTLLRALEVGVYNHALGDGREYVVTHPLAMKIRAEDRRSVQGIDISPFISRLAVPTTSFCTSDASGSTSQAANMVEALELGSPVLLLDEDTCATNLMYRDHAMCQLISPDAEPITTLLQRLPELLATGTSLIVVAGGSGQYFAHANLVIAMDKYVAKNVTGRAKEIAAQLQQPQQQLVSAAGILSSTRSRLIDVAGSCLPLREDADREGAVSVRAHGIRSVTCGPSEIDLSHVEQLVEVGQTNAISAALAWLVDHPPPGAVSTENVVARMAQVLTSQRLMNVVTPSFRGPLGFLALPRTLEIGAALNRLRTLRATSQTAPSSQPPK